MIDPQPNQIRLEGLQLTGGAAAGPLLWSDTGLSFWGGVDGATGEIIDRTHPLAGRCATGAVLAIPSGRGSCTASGVLIELITTGKAPAAIILCEDELILPLGAMVAEEVFGRSLPIMRLTAQDFRKLEGRLFAAVSGDTVVYGPEPLQIPTAVVSSGARPVVELPLTPGDIDMLSGGQGAARATAMRVIMKMAELSGATALISVTQAHLDCCIYTGPSSLALAEHFRDRGGRCAVPTTMNAISADLRPGTSAVAGLDLTEASRRQAAAYVAMGATASFTCAPYLLEGCPSAGEHIGWAESNAVMFANSVLGARTQKYPDYLDICVALTGRAPHSGCHLDAGRQAEVIIDVSLPAGVDDSFWPLAGYVAGKLSPTRIPVLAGLEETAPNRDDLKAFCAAFATSSGAPMVHLAGITPEAQDVAMALGGKPAAHHLALDLPALVAGWHDLNGGEGRIALVALGNPHFSATELEELARLVDGHRKHPDVAVVVTTSRAVLAQAKPATAALEAFGVRFIADTCWCMLGNPVVGPETGRVMTNSAKYAHYGPGLTGAVFSFGSLAACAEAACTGEAPSEAPGWLT